ncbi:MAG: AI-2E family transporter [bacterium]|nr:AI-2E family transporter [bacterium]
MAKGKKRKITKTADSNVVIAENVTLPNESSKVPKVMLRRTNFDEFKESLLNLLFSKDFLLTVFIVTVFALMTHLFWATLLPLFVAFVLAYLINPLVRKIEKWRYMNREGAIAAVFIGLVFAALVLVIPMAFSLGKNVVTMADEISSIEYKPLINKIKTNIREFKNMEVPQSLQKPANYLRAPIGHVINHFEQYQEKIEKLLRTVNTWAGSMFRKIGGLLLNSTQAVFQRTMDFVIVTLFLIYLLIDFERIHGLFMKIVPVSYRPWMLEFSDRANETLKLFLIGQFKVACIFGFMMTLGLWFLGVKFWMVIGPLSGIANMVPYLGVIFGLGPALIMAIYQGAVGGAGVFLFLYVLLLFAIVQFIDGNLVQPKIVGESVGLHPLVIILALFVGAELMGIYGMLFAVPAAAVLKVLVVELYDVLYEGRSGLLRGR